VQVTEIVVFSAQIGLAAAAVASAVCWIVEFLLARRFGFYLGCASIVLVLLGCALLTYLLLSRCAFSNAGLRLAR
jgi:hypothetical protein